MIPSIPDRPDLRFYASNLGLCNRVEGQLREFAGFVDGAIDADYAAAAGAQHREGGTRVAVKWKLDTNAPDSMARSLEALVAVAGSSPFAESSRVADMVSLSREFLSMCRDRAVGAPWSGDYTFPGRLRDGARSLSTLLEELRLDLTAMTRTVD